MKEQSVLLLMPSAVSFRLFGILIFFAVVVATANAAVATVPSSLYAYTVANPNNEVDNTIVNYSTNLAYNQLLLNQNRKNFYFKDNNSNNNNNADRISATATSPSSTSGCTLDRLAVYKVVLQTYWTRDLFPKHYPDWRPSAQWTKTLGRTHDSSFSLFHIGQPASAGVKQFAETGKSDIFESSSSSQTSQQQSTTGGGAPGITLNSFTSATTSSASLSTPTSSSSSGSGGASEASSLQRSVFDEFVVSAITTGAGRSEAKFFVDSNHSLVSLMTRIVPSPDWFIGVDSFQLCVGGSWIDTVTVEMDPLDAGTDNGFTFTAPNWPTSPQGVIYRITSRYPAHPAGSFFYPKSKRLPPMATFQFIKLKEYELSEVFNFVEDDRRYETVHTQAHLETEHNHVEMNNELSASIERERQTEVGTAIPGSVTERDRVRSRLLAKMNPINNSTNVVPKNDKNAILQSIASNYNYNYNRTNKQQQHKKRVSGRRSRDCRVGHWSDWSTCSKSCGIGEMHRYRKIIKHGKRGGRPCPALQESKWCGSEKGCHSPVTYFNWSNT
ncbi:spondin-1 [Episyrphus balteatus]|uniref:spondin-1 n=1 Tax=Episyrphus balteatus TaxID=286459 RepID=UPI002486A2B7|nr:spondin-1 [Episyrphus balteatus]